MQVQVVGFDRALTWQTCFVSFQDWHDLFPLCAQHKREHHELSKWQMDVIKRENTM